MRNVLDKFVEKTQNTSCCQCLFLEIVSRKCGKIL